MEYNYPINEGVHLILQKCRLPDKAKTTVEWMAARLTEERLPFADYGWKSLVNHICAMVNRSVSGEVLDIDAELFDEVSQYSIQLSAEVVEHIGRIAMDEKYLLSMHFENARDNL